MLYSNGIHINRKEKNPDEELLPPEGIIFEVRVESDLKAVYKLLQKTLQVYKDEKKGPTLLAVQSTMDTTDFQRHIPLFSEFPQVQIHVQVGMKSVYYNNMKAFGVYFQVILFVQVV